MKSACIVEVPTPKMSGGDPKGEKEAFEARYRMVVEAGFVVAMPDNPAGVPHFQALGLIKRLRLPVPAGQVLLQVNSFHSRKGLADIFRQAEELGVEDLLLVTGDCEGATKPVDSEARGANRTIPDSIGLLEYVRRSWPGRFRLGVAYNHYAPADGELRKLKLKKDAGAGFVITQPAVGLDMRIQNATGTDLPAYIGVWMSKRLKGLSRCVGFQVPDWHLYEPMENLLFLRRRYPQCGLYLSMVNFQRQFKAIAKLMDHDGGACQSGCCCSV